METAGQKLKHVRERLGLRYRDVEKASLRIAGRHGNAEFSIALSRLADIENRGTIPSLYRVYSLCAIYRLEPAEVLRWYGVDPADIAADAALIELDVTHLVQFGAPEAESAILAPAAMDPGFDPRRTTHFSRMVQRWGKLSLAALRGADLKNKRYGYIGAEDWFMYPLLQPASFVVIDETRRRIVAGGWASEFERPIYFFETRTGYACGWAGLDGGKLVLEPHPASACSPRVYAFPEEIDVVGQVTAVATRLDPPRRRRARS